MSMMVVMQRLSPPLCGAIAAVFQDVVAVRKKTHCRFPNSLEVSVEWGRRKRSTGRPE